MLLGERVRPVSLDSHVVRVQNCASRLSSDLRMDAFRYTQGSVDALQHSTLSQPPKTTYPTKSESTYLDIATQAETRSMLRKRMQENVHVRGVAG